MNKEQMERLEELEAILSAISIDSDDVIEDATTYIQRWIMNTRNVKGYCRT